MRIKCSTCFVVVTVYIAVVAIVVVVAAAVAAAAAAAAAVMTSHLLRVPAAQYILRCHKFSAEST